MPRPNFLVICTDQQRRDSLGCYRDDSAGRPWPRTPAIDALAARGLRFTRAYTPCGVCSPTRCSFVTGRYPHNHGVVDNIAPGHVAVALDPAVDHSLRRLADAGYRLGHVGKWHVHHGPSTDFGFHEHDRVGALGCDRRVAGLRPMAEPCEPLTQLAVEDAPRELSAPWRYALQAREMMRRYAATGLPWLVRVDINEPHFPYRPLREFYERFDPAAIPPWPNFHGDLPDEPRVVREYRRVWNMSGLTWDHIAPLVAGYFATVEMMDAAVGMLLEALAELPGGDETFVIFTTDHGDTIGAHGLFDKGYSACDEVYHVPFVTAGPGISPGTTCKAPVVHAIDLAPTLLELADAEPLERCDGRSLVPLLTGDPPPDWRESACAEFHGMWFGGHTQRMIWHDEWKYVLNAADRDELYDLASDPWELANRIDDPAAVEVREDLRRRLWDWIAASGDPLDNRWSRKGHAPG